MPRRDWISSIERWPWWAKALAGYSVVALVSSVAGSIGMNRIIDHGSEVLGQDLSAVYTEWQAAYAATKEEAASAYAALASVARAAVEEGESLGVQAFKAWKKIYDPLGLIGSDTYTPRERPPEIE